MKFCIDAVVVDVVVDFLAVTVLYTHQQTQPAKNKIYEVNECDAERIKTQI